MRARAVGYAPYPMTHWKPLLLNVVLFQAGWFACVVGAAHEREAPAVLLSAVIVAWHIARAKNWRGELALVALVTLAGGLWDSFMGLAGGLALRTAWPADWPALLAPAWILALWALFATTLNVSLGWLHGRFLAAAALGALFGPLTYLAGARLGAASIARPLPTLTLIALGWAVLLPALLRLAQALRPAAPVREPPAPAAAGSPPTMPSRKPTC